MIGDTYGNETIFQLGRKTGEWDEVADLIEGFGASDKLDLTNLGITDSTEITASGNELQRAADNTVIAEFSSY